MHLSPTQAASLSSDVYLLSTLSKEAAVSILNNNYAGTIAFLDDNVLTGHTGGPGALKVRTAFGFCLKGQGAYERNAFVIFRGTQYLADWLTNLNVSLARSTSGQLIHDGFHTAFQSMLPQIENAMASFAEGSTVHCIGHSLGGALATLAAEWFATSTEFNKPYLYTFGSPRVGLDGFSLKCTELLRVDRDRVFRSYHRTDVVPYIPLWPYVHTPYSGRDYFLPSPGALPGAEWHDMKKYVHSVKGETWETLYHLRPPKNSESGIEKWLQSSAIIGASMVAIEWLNDAIAYVVQRCFECIGINVSHAASTSMTLLDRLAFLLNEGANAAKDVSTWVLLLMKKIIQFLGWSKGLESFELTQQFIRQMLENLSVKINTHAKSALNTVLADGHTL